MNKITECKKCIFCNDDSWCHFNIPQAITNNQIQVDHNLKIINNYACSYAFGKDTFTKNTLFSKEDIINRILDINHIKYTLILNFDTINKSKKDILDKISNDFKPKNMVCFGKTVESDLVEYFETNIDIPWKVNKILPHIDEQISIISAIDTIIDKYHSANFLYISHPDTFDNLEKVMNTIHITSVINHNYGIYLNNLSSLDGMFMTYDVYKILAEEKTKLFYDTKQFFIDNPNCKCILYND
jgi:hypothetical protein